MEIVNEIKWFCNGLTVIFGMNQLLLNNVYVSLRFFMVFIDSAEIDVEEVTDQMWEINTN